MQSQRIAKFAQFFKRYMGVAAVVTAALPIPIAAFGTIPTFSHQKAELATYTSLVCFLLLAYTFYLRHSIASIVFLHRHSRRKLAKIVDALPLLLIVLSLASMFLYQALLVQSINASELREMDFQSMQLAQVEHQQKTSTPATPAAGNAAPTTPLWGTDEGHRRASMTYILQNTEQNSIDSGWLLMALYLLIFMCAESAFVLMALREYLQDVLNLSEREIVENISVPPSVL